MIDARVVVLDDFAPLLSRLRRVLEQAGRQVTTYDSPLEFLARPPPTPPCCLLLDVEMPGLSGLDVQRRLLGSSALLPMIFMSGVRDVPAAIEAMKNGAVDFLLKPFADDAMLAAVDQALERSRTAVQRQAALTRARERLATLTPRERDVCLLVAEGLTSKEIGARLGVAEGTVALHRAHLMAKLQAGSVAEVVRMVDLAGQDG